mmetsp:Transcript_6996/g.15270  ORF Transcript_6996/g.15270 Transcript_6996/m.15270 type:complete len:212 (-) Transcript_6996:158-793(-)
MDTATPLTSSSGLPVLANAATIGPVQPPPAVGAAKADIASPDSEKSELRTWNPIGLPTPDTTTRPSFELTLSSRYNTMTVPPSAVLTLGATISCTLTNRSATTSTTGFTSSMPSRLDKMTNLLTPSIMLKCFPLPPYNLCCILRLRSTDSFSPTSTTGVQPSLNDARSPPLSPMNIMVKAPGVVPSGTGTRASLESTALANVVPFTTTSLI